MVLLSAAYSNPVPPIAVPSSAALTSKLNCPVAESYDKSPAAEN